MPSRSAFPKLQDDGALLARMTSETIVAFGLEGATSYYDKALGLFHQEVACACDSLARPRQRGSGPNHRRWPRQALECELGIYQQLSCGRARFSIFSQSAVNAASRKRVAVPPLGKEGFLHLGRLNLMKKLKAQGITAFTRTRRQT